jgi:proprotein convertase subtilisin/kexin type 5
LFGSNCITNCGDGYYENTANRICEACEVPGCKTCSSGVSTCDSCNGDVSPPFYLKSGSCVYTCGDGFYEDDSDNTCGTCHSTCATCDGGLSTNCLTCPSTGTNIWKKNGDKSCVSDCG